MAMDKNLWNIANRPSTRAKLEILRKCFDVWITIWNNQNWASKEWYVIDLFAGRGNYADQNGESVSGSPLIFLETVANKKGKIKQNIKIELFLVEKNKGNFICLKENVDKFYDNNPFIRDVVEVKYFNNDCNKVIKDITSQIKNTSKHPLFIFIDPTGLQIEKPTTKAIIALKNPKDIMLNYILEGVRRTSGIAKKAQYGGRLNIQEISTLETLEKFKGEDVDVISASDRKILEDYVSSLFTCRNLKVVACDMKYPDREDILYYLLYASRNPSITDIVKNIYAKQKEKSCGQALFKGFYADNILSFSSKVKQIKKKTLLYKTKVEYGDWTINHIIGCMHGCRFPCYAMRMAQKFGWVKNYEDWRIPRITINAMELLGKEIPKYKSEIDFVHLCFMSDPFMYDIKEGNLIPEVKELTLRIIEKLNKEGIRVTTLTKGFYPDEVLDKKRFLRTNEYGITLVSLDNEFKEKFEPFSAPYEKRIESLTKLAKAGLKTWVSIEPYPTPELDKTADNIGTLLEKVKFVSKIIFGKLNYRRLNYDGGSSQVWENNHDFYRKKAQEIIDFCKKKDIEYHIKLGTPLSKKNTIYLFKNNHTLKNQ
jgi:three-Cys-motif partner protein